MPGLGQILEVEASFEVYMNGYYWDACRLVLLLDMMWWGGLVRERRGKELFEDTAVYWAGVGWPVGQCFPIFNMWVYKAVIVSSLCHE